MRNSQGQIDEAKEPSLSDPAVVQDPYALYRKLCQQGSILRRESLFGGAWLVMGFDDVKAAFADWQHFSSRRSGALVDAMPASQQARYRTLLGLHSRWLSFLDPPEHTRVRRVVSRGFTAGVRERLVPTVRHCVDTLIDRFAARGEAELVSELAREVPRITIAALLGIEPEDRLQLAELTDAIAAYVGLEAPDLSVMDAAQSSLVKFDHYFRKAIKRRRENPAADDMLSLLLHAREGEELLREEEVVAQCALIGFAGTETTVNLIANSLYCLLRHRQELQLLEENPERITDAIEEALRFECPVQFIGRRIREDCELRGTQLTSGEWAVLMIGAANRDGTKNPDPDRFDISRPQRHFLSFGHGPHGCLGGALAIVEAQTAVSRFLERCPNPRLAGEDPAPWRCNPGLRGLERLQVRF